MLANASDGSTDALARNPCHIAPDGGLMRSVRAFLAGTIMAGIIVVAAACGSDFSTQPMPPAQADAPARSLLTPSPLGSFSRSGDLAPGQYNATVRFTINPRSDTYVQIGPHFLYIPAGAVCDPTI